MLVSSAYDLYSTYGEEGNLGLLMQLEVLNDRGSGLARLLQEPSRFPLRVLAQGWSCKLEVRLGQHD